MRIALIALIFMAPLSLGALPASAQETSPGGQLAQACTSCHGLQGRSLGAVPSLAGRPAADLVALLKTFRDAPNEATIMNRITRGYTDDEIAALAAYFSAMSPTP
ncbi:MAG: cytochrome c subunit of flavocytochrome c sulfide dehydrogenase [Devosia sp.]|nr:cytochrome c subunit of flavocytochrome c sulfide dehydrogenase [Devosia sp.]